MSLDGQIALVTGAGRRVGRAIALELARAGCDVAIHFNRSRDEAEACAKLVRSMGRRASTIQGDLEDASSWAAVVAMCVAAFGRLDTLVNNASLFLSDQEDTIESFLPETWERMLRVNLIAPTGLVHHARRHLEASPNGNVVNLCDISAERPWRRHLAYCASKAGLVAVTRSLAKALAPTVRVNGVAPGIAEFPDDYDDATRTRLVREVPLDRAGTPAEVASLVRYLVESGRYITGQVIAIDGGRSVV